MSKKNLGYFHAAVPSALLAGALPYAVMRKGDKESDEKFKARRRGMSAASGALGFVAGGQFIPPALLGRSMKKTSGLRSKVRGMLESERKSSKGALQEQRDKALQMLLFGSDKRKEEQRSKRRAKRKKEGFVGRGRIASGMLGLGGLGMISKNLPQVAGAKGSQMLYHGTGAGPIGGILSDDSTKSGLKLEYAGTKGRLNAQLMPNAVVKEILESSDLDIDNMELARVQAKVNAAIKSNKGTPIADLIKEEISDFAAHNDLPSHKTDKLKKRAVSALKNAGMRIYFGDSPDKIMHWSDNKNEAQKIMSGFGEEFGGGEGLEAQLKMQKTVAKAGLNVSTGGVGPEFQGMRRQHGFMRDLSIHPERVSPAFIRDLAESHVGEKPLQFALGAHIPTEDVQMLADFKGIRTPLRLSPGIQSILGEIPGFHGYNPSADISTAKDVGRSAIKHVDVLNPESNKAVRYMLDSYEAPKLTGMQRLKSLRQAAVPLALTGIGADAVYRAVSGRRGVLGTALERYRARKEKRRERKLVKTSSAAHRPYMTAAKNTLKYGVPALGLGLGMGVLQDKVGRTVIPVSGAEHSPESLKDDVEGIAREATRGGVGKLAKGAINWGALGASGALGAYLATKKVKASLPRLVALAQDASASAHDRKMAKDFLEEKLRLAKHFGGVAGTMVPGISMLGATVALNKYKRAARGQDDLRTELGESPESQMKTPWKSAVVPALATAAVLGTGLASASKHFPGLIRGQTAEAASRMPHIMKGEAKSMLETTLKAVNAGKPLSPHAHSLIRNLEGHDSGALGHELKPLLDLSEKIRKKLPNNHVLNS